MESNLATTDESGEGDLTGGEFAFIVGCPRSGTTWLQRLLATHPQVKTGHESRLFEYISSQFRLWRQDMNSTGNGRGGSGLICYFSEKEFFAVQKKYLRLLVSPMLKSLQTGQVFLEKTPAHALCVPEIIKLLPQTKIIHLVRDPHDVVASLLAASRSWGQKWAPSRASKAARIWWKHVSSAQSAKALLPEGQFLEINYEELCSNPALTLRQIADFLSLPWSDAEIVNAIKINTVGELRQGKGTPIPVSGELGARQNQVVKEPENFIRKARPGSWHEDLTWIQRWQVWRVLRKIAPEWRRYTKRPSSGIA